jgi:hypothetical protein
MMAMARDAVPPLRPYGPTPKRGGASWTSPSWLWGTSVKASAPTEKGTRDRGSCPSQRVRTHFYHPPRFLIGCPHGLSNKHPPESA